MHLMRVGQHERVASPAIIPMRISHERDARACIALESSRYADACPMSHFLSLISVTPEDAGRRLDQFLTGQLANVSRARVQQLIADGKVLVNDVVARASLRLHGGERIFILGTASPPPLPRSLWTRIRPSPTWAPAAPSPPSCASS